MVKKGKKSLHKAYLKWEGFTGSWCLRH